MRTIKCATNMKEQLKALEILHRILHHAIERDDDIDL